MLAQLDHDEQWRERSATGFGVKLLLPHSLPNDRPTVHVYPTKLVIVPTRECRLAMVNRIAADAGIYDHDAAELVETQLPFREVQEPPLRVIDQSAGDKLEVPWPGAEPSARPSFMLELPYSII